MRNGTRATPTSEERAYTLLRNVRFATIQNEEQISKTIKTKIMAIYHFSGSIISRSQGRSAIAAAAYRSAEKLADVRQGVVHDYSKKQEVVHTEIFLPAGAPESFKNREVLWNTVEQQEQRKDAQLAREFTISLPRELTIEQNKALITEFVTHEFVAKGMIADVCFHNDVMKDGNRQPHAHVMLTLREVNEQGFGKKVREWNDKELLLHWRESWANSANRHLALHGFDLHIDHRSNEARGIELEPQYKIGPSDARKQLARFEDHQRIARENGQVLFARPEIALDALTKEQSTFTHHDLARLIHRHTQDAAQFQQVFEKVKSCCEMVFLGLDSKGVQRFSTQSMLNMEASMMRAAENLNKRAGHEVSDVAIKNAKATRSLSLEQEAALHYLTTQGDLKSVVGYAGTGKSYLLGAASEAWEASGYRVQGAALSGIAALNLKNSSSIESRTLASLFYHLDKGTLHLDARDVLVVDEAGMLGTRIMERLTREVERAGAKLVLVGDPQQLQAIEAGAPFRALTQAHQYAELSQIRRQAIPWQVEASRDLALGLVAKALDAYQEHDHLHQFKFQYEAKEALINLWQDARIVNPEQSQLILAYTRREVAELNALARAQRHKDKELGEEAVFAMGRGERAFAVNDRVYFLKREDSLSVINGTLGTICAINKQSGVIRVELDRDEVQQKPRIVAVNTAHYTHLEHGYAATVYKAQGVTVDRAYVLPSKHYDAHATYVAMTRHRQSCDVFVSTEAFPNETLLQETLSRNRAKDLTCDYTRMEPEFARLRALTPEHDEVERPNFEIRPLTEEDKTKLAAFLHEGMHLKHSRGDRPVTLTREDLFALKRRFEQEHPERARQLRQELFPNEAQEIASALSRNPATTVNERAKEGLAPHQEPLLKQKQKVMPQRELEMDL